MYVTHIQANVHDPVYMKIIRYGRISSLGDSRSSKGQKYPYYCSDSVFYLIFVVQLLKFTKNHGITLFYTLLRSCTLCAMSCQKPSLVLLIKYTFTLVLYLLLAGIPDQADNKKECTMVKLMLLFLHVLKPTWKFQKWKQIQAREVKKHIYYVWSGMGTHSLVTSALVTTGSSGMKLV